MSVNAALLGGVRAAVLPIKAADVCGDESKFSELFLPQTFYGVPDSGMVPNHNLFHSAFRGPQWLTGGIVGPEASVLTPIALLVVALVFSHYHREDRYQIQGARSMPGTAL